MTQIAFPRRLKLWLAAWAIGLVAAAFPYPILIAYIWFFPAGWMEAVGWKRTGHDTDYFIGWLPYVILSIAGLLSRPRLLYFLFYGVLCILLLLNAAGCQHIHAKMRGM